MGARSTPAAGGLAGFALGRSIAGLSRRGGGGGRGELVDAGPELGDPLAVLAGPLVLPLALLAQARLQLLDTGVVALAQAAPGDDASIGP